MVEPDHHSSLSRIRYSTITKGIHTKVHEGIFQLEYSPSAPFYNIQSDDTLARQFYHFLRLLYKS